MRKLKRPSTPFVITKRCPFCGGHPRFQDDRTAGWLVCMKCGASTGYVESSARISAYDKAVKAWNKRWTK